MPLDYGEGENGAFQRLRGVIQNDQIVPIRDPALEASVNQCLAALRLSDPRDDKTRIQFTEGGILKDTHSSTKE